MDYKDFLSTEQKKELSFWHKARLNLVSHLLNNALGHNKNLKILDIGCGTGTELKILNNFGQVTALDVNNKVIKMIQKNNYQTILADVEKYNLANNYYDIVCCFDILEHLNNDQRVIKNIYMSLKTGGFFFFTVPAFNFLFGTHDIAMEHKRRYSKRDVLLKLNKAGFKIIKINYWNFFLFLPEAAVRIIKKVLFIKLFKKNRYKSNMKSYNNFINRLLFCILNLENKLISCGRKIPFGLTIYGAAKK